MARWIVPASYFLLCELLGLLYELGLKSQISGSIGMLAAFVLILLTFPGMPIGGWAKDQSAMLLGISSTDAIAYSSFWPRFAGWQTSIVVCTLALGLITHLAARAFWKR
jgi:hypothetical protein